MPYCKSAARTAFDRRIRELERNALTIHRRKRERGELRALVYRACIVEGCSALEEYFDSVVSSWIYLVVKNGVPLRRVPGNVFSFDLLTKARQITKSLFQEKGEKELLLIAERTYRKLLVFRAEDQMPTWINGSYLLSEKKFPSPKNIEIVLLRIGVEDFFDEIARKSKRNFRQLLKAFVGIRSAVAHEAPPLMTFDDVARDLKMLRSFVGWADRIFYSHIILNTGQSCWERSIFTP